VLPAAVFRQNDGAETLRRPFDRTVDHEVIIVMNERQLVIHKGKAAFDLFF
jgi:hypothetical protein